MKIPDIYIIKANGEKEIFDIQKLQDSLKRAGANNEIIEDISRKIVGELKNGMHTKDIYKKAFTILNKKEKKIAVKFSIRKGITDLGPQGFPFEDFIGEIYRSKGFRVEVGKTINGHCVIHELDVVAQNDKEFLAAEIKFHNSFGIKSDLKTSLYVKARFDDLADGDYYKALDQTKKQKRMLITNTKFTSRAIEYGTCAGLTMIGWNYPSKGNLQDLIEEEKLHPLTLLTTLNKKQKQTLLSQGIVLCKDICAGGENILKTVGVRGLKIQEVLDEANSLCDK